MIRKTVIVVLMLAAARTHETHAEPGDLNDNERSLAERLRREQYASDNWNRRI